MPAKSKKQQQFFGMVRNCQKNKECPSKKISRVAKNMKTGDVKKFASTKHKKLPNKVKEDTMNENKLIVTFINNIYEKKYTDAKGVLGKIVESKIMKRISSIVNIEKQ